ncbi:MAG: prepilin-type N-terminal cleavage/methylation domain-containing protein [Candidatus Omnitrophica bacterium]|nr:prepilin-type N-terminal cleavage/methylation domain-containing protein [Candidatus Omnitrophota bacterium]
MNKKGFTLLEILVVIIIIGILSTLGFSQYASYKEKTLDREAKTNLLLIAAGERIVRLESNDNSYVLPSPNNNAGINQALRMILPTASPTNWTYGVLTYSTSSFCASATRTANGQTRAFHILSPSSIAPDPQVQDGTCTPTP